MENFKNRVYKFLLRSADNLFRKVRCVDCRNAFVLFNSTEEMMAQDIICIAEISAKCDGITKALLHRL